MLDNQVNTRDIYSTNPGEFLKNTRFANDWEDSAFQSTQAYSQGNSSQLENSQTSSYELFSQKLSQQPSTVNQRNEPSSDQSKYHLKYLSMPPLFGKDNAHSEKSNVMKSSLRSIGHIEQFEFNKQKARERDERDLINKIFAGVRTCVEEVKSAAESIKETMNRGITEGTEQSAQLINKVNKDLTTHYQTLLETLKARDEDKGKMAEMEKMIAMKDSKIDLLQSQLEEAQKQQQKDIIETLKSAYNEQQKLNREQLEKFQQQREKGYTLPHKEILESYNNVAYNSIPAAVPTCTGTASSSLVSATHNDYAPANNNTLLRMNVTYPEMANNVGFSDTNQAPQYICYSDRIQSHVQNITYQGQQNHRRSGLEADDIGHLRSVASAIPHETNMNAQANLVRLGMGFKQNEVAANAESRYQQHHASQNVPGEQLRNQPMTTLCQTLPMTLTSPTVENSKWAGAARAKAKQSPVATVMPQVKKTAMSTNCDEKKEDASDCNEVRRTSRKRSISGSQSNEHATRKSQRLVTRQEVSEPCDKKEKRSATACQQKYPSKKYLNSSGDIYDYKDDDMNTPSITNIRKKIKDGRSKKAMQETRSLSSIPSQSLHYQVHNTKKIDRNQSCDKEVQIRDENVSNIDEEGEIPPVVRRSVKRERRTPSIVPCRNQSSSSASSGTGKTRISHMDTCTRDSNILKISNYYSDSEESSPETFSLIIPDSPVFMKTPEEHRYNISKDEDDFWSCSSSTPSNPMQNEYKVSRSVEGRRKLSNFSLKASGISIPNIRRSVKVYKDQ